MTIVIVYFTLRKCCIIAQLQGLLSQSETIYPLPGAGPRRSSRAPSPGSLTCPSGQYDRFLKGIKCSCICGSVFSKWKHSDSETMPCHTMNHMVQCIWSENSWIWKCLTCWSTDVIKAGRIFSSPGKHCRPTLHTMVASSFFCMLMLDLPVKDYESILPSTIPLISWFSWGWHDHSDEQIHPRP